MYTELAVIIGIIAVNLPFMVLTLQSVIEGIERNVEEAAFSLGAPPMTMARRVLFPLALPGILAGVILTFILAMNAYATPVLLGGPKFQTMGPLVFSTFAQQNNWPFGGADDETVKTVARAQPQAVPNPPAPAKEPAPRAATPDAAIPGAADEARRRLIAAQHATLASADALGIPNQRSAAFNPLQPAATPPRNRYLEATRRQQANFGTARLEVEDSSVRANCG